MTSSKYIGMDVHKESISSAIRNAAGKSVMESVIETKGSVVLDFIDGVRGDMHVTVEEETWSAWLYDLLRPRVTRLVVCDPRRNALLLEGNQNHRVDARKLAELLQNNQLRPVYHGDHGLRALKELVCSYLTITQDLSRVMTWVKAVYSSWGIACSCKQVYTAPSTEPGPFEEFYAVLVAKGMRPEMARVTLARKIVTIVLIVWKKGVCFDANHLKPQTA
jgi:transposase